MKLFLLITLLTSSLFAEWQMIGTKDGTFMYSTVSGKVYGFSSKGLIQVPYVGIKKDSGKFYQYNTAEEVPDNWKDGEEVKLK